MKYRGYTATVTFDSGLRTFQGSVVGANSVISFEAETVATLRAAFAGAIDEYLAFCEQEGVAPDAPGNALR